MNLPRVAVIGVGHLGRIHSRLAKQGGCLDLVAVVDPMADARQALAAELGVEHHADCGPLRGRIDAAIVATPTVYHHEVAMQLLRHGVHTLVEKPLADSVAQAAEMVEAAKAARAVLQVGHVERFNPAWTALGPEWNQARYLEATRTSSYSFRSTDIGVVHDLMIHDLDLILSRCTAPVISVQASSVTVIGPHEDVAHARLEFADGRVALLRASRVCARAERTMQLYAAHGHALLDFSTPSVSIVDRSVELRDGQFHPQSVAPADRTRYQQRLFEDLLPTTTLTLDPVNAIAEEQTDFAACVCEGREPIVSGVQALRALRVADQVVAAARAQSGNATGMASLKPAA